MQRRQLGGKALAVGMAMAFPFIAKAQPKQMRIVVPFTAGSGSDAGARVYADILSKLLNRPIIVDNKPGASGVIAIKAVLAEPADGNTILLGSNSLIAVNPVMVKNLSYDPFKDLMPLHGVGISAAAIVAGSNSEFRSIRDVIKKYEATKTPISVGNYSEGYRLVGEWLALETGIKVLPVPYKGGSPMITDLLGGRLDIAMNDISGVLEMERAKKVRILAITGEERDFTIPDVPTMKELGYPEMESYVWSSFSIKAGTPDATRKELAAAITEVQKHPDIVKYHSTRPGKVLALSLEELGAFQRQEYQRFKKIAERENIQPS